MSACEATAPAQALINAVPTIPRNDDGPIFAEPWQAQAFAMTLALHERGLFTWLEWADALSRQIKAAQAIGDPDLGDTYYQHWLAALEQLIVEKGVSNRQALHDCADAWDRAARATPHGEPIHLSNDARHRERHKSS